MSFCVYAHVDPTLAVPFYIGKGNFKRAMSLFRRNLFHQERVQQIRSLGLEPIVEILFNDLSEEEALQIEEREIMRFGREDQGTGCLLNLTNGGEWGSPMKGKTHSIETKRKMSLSLLGNSRNSGKKLSEEHKRRISNSMLKHLYGEST